MRSATKTNPFPKAHLWLLLPFLVTILGFYFSYWSKFSEAPFRHHAHGITATLWYALLIIQPYVYHKRSIKLHRKIGFIGLFLAGGVVFSALQVIPYNIVSGLPETLKYGLSFYDLASLIGFSTAIIMAMFYSKQLHVHARWMISTVFWALLPAVARLIFFPLYISSNGEPPIAFIDAIYISMAVIAIPLLVMIVLDYMKYKKIYFSYVFALVGTSILTLLIELTGTNQWWIDWCKTVLVRGI